MAVDGRQEILHANAALENLFTARVGSTDHSPGSDAATSEKQTSS